MKLGMNYLSGEYSTLLSWQLENGVQFLIEGKEANLIFKAFHSAAQPANKGFQISYKAIGEHQHFISNPSIFISKPINYIQPFQSEFSLRWVELCIV